MILLEVDPDLVQPGWTPLVITVLLGIVIVLLYLSMRRQFRKISIPREGEADDPEAPGADEPAPDRSDRTGTTTDAPRSTTDPPSA